MKFSELIKQVRLWLEREERVSYRALKLEFELTDDMLDALKEELIEAKRVAEDEDGKVLVWTAKGSLMSSGQRLESEAHENTPIVPTLDARPKDGRPPPGSDGR